MMGSRLRGFSARASRAFGPLGVLVLLFALALLSAGVSIAQVPLGGSELDALSALRDLMAPGVEQARALVTARSQGLPAVNLALAWFFSFLPVRELTALRLPDALAIVPTLWGAGQMAARATTSTAARLAATALIVASGLVWWLPVTAPGLWVDMAAVMTLAASLLASAADAREGNGQRRLALAFGLIALAVLIANAAGPMAIAVIGGCWLHRGLAGGDWRLAGSHRLTGLAWLVLAGLTLTDQLTWPSIARLSQALHQAGTALGLALPLSILSLAWIVALVLAALVLVFWLLAADARRAGGRFVVVVAISLVVMSSARLATPLAPVAVLVLAPVGMVSTAWRNGLAGRVWYGVCTVAAGLGFLGLAGGMLAMASRGSVVVYGALGLGALLVVAALVSRWRAVGGHRGGELVLWLAAVGMGQLALSIQVEWLFAQRTFDAELVSDLAADRARPMAILAPASAQAWRVRLDRPLYEAASLDALCAWAAHVPSAHPPMVLSHPGQAATLAGRLVGWHPVLQSPGTPQRSLIAARLDTTRCRAGKALGKD